MRPENLLRKLYGHGFVSEKMNWVEKKIEPWNRLDIYQDMWDIMFFSLGHVSDISTMDDKSTIIFKHEYILIKLLKLFYKWNIERKDRGKGITGLYIDIASQI